MSVNMMAASLRCSVLALIGRQSRLCKRCAASARRRNCRSSFLRAENLLNQGFKPRMAAEWVKEGIYFGKRDVGTGAISVSALKPVDCFVFFAKRYVHESEAVAGYISPRGQFLQLAEHLERFVALTEFRVRLRQYLEDEWIVIDFG